MSINFVDHGQLRAEGTFRTIRKIRYARRVGRGNRPAGRKGGKFSPMIETTTSVKKKARPESDQVFHVYAYGLLASARSKRGVGPSVYKNNLVACAPDLSSFEPCYQCLVLSRSS